MSEANDLNENTSVWVRRARRSGLACALVAWGISAPTVLAQTNFCYAVADGGDRFVRINRDGGGFVNIGGVGVPNIEAMAIQPGTDIIYASNQIDGSNGELGLIDPATGLFTSNENSCLSSKRHDVVFLETHADAIDAVRIPFAVAHAGQGRCVLLTSCVRRRLGGWVVGWGDPPTGSVCGT